MSIKKKLIAALLSVTCMTAGAFGLAACSNGKDGSDGKDGANGKSAYELAVENGFKGTVEEWLESLKGTDGSKGDKGDDGTNGLSAYELFVKAYTLATGSAEGCPTESQWLDSLKGETGQTGDKGETGLGVKEIVEVRTDSSAYFLFIMTDGTQIEVPMNTSYSVKCVDTNGNPVAGVKLRMGYYDSKKYTSVYFDSAVSDKNGNVTFYGLMVPQYKYGVYLAEEENAVPQGYEVNFEEINHNNFEDFTTTLVLRDMKNSFSIAVRDNKVTAIPYTRVAGASGAVENNGTADGKFSLTVKKDVYSYLSFATYVNPGSGDTSEETDELLNNAALAANGIYKISVSSGVLYYFDGTSSNTAVDRDTGIPSSVLAISGEAPEGASEDEKALYSGENSVTVSINSVNARRDYILGIYSEKQAKVTITVERVGDAEEPKPVPVIKAAVPENLAAYPAGTGTLKDMPTNGTLPVLKGNDGYYHVGSENGPVLLVQLNTPMNRVADLALTKLHTAPEGLGEAVYTVAGTKDSEEVRYDCFDFITEYSAKANKDGVYGVNDELFVFLNAFAAKGIGHDIFNVKNVNDRWLLYCQYYEPAGGLPLNGEGTEETPYLLWHGTNTFRMPDGGTAYLEFNADANTVYRFGNTDITVTASEGITSVIWKDALYVCAENSAILKLQLTGDEDSYTFTADEADNVKTIKALWNDDNGGLSGNEANPVTVITGIYNVIVNTEQFDENEVWIQITVNAPLIDYYEIYITDGSDGQLWIDDELYEAGDKLYGVKGQTYKIRITTEDDEAGNFMLIVDGKTGTVPQN